MVQKKNINEKLREYLM